MLHNVSEKFPSFYLHLLFGKGWMGVDLFLLCRDS
jgi:hypothetical protein